MPLTRISPLIVIVGQTASGKSALAMELARKFDGEIIAADSRTVYKAMDIGTAKPSFQDRQAIRHHLLDLVEPDQPFSVADFQAAALAAIDDIAARGKVPILVGGSGLYIDSVIYGFSFRRSAGNTERSMLDRLSVSELQDLLIKQGIALPNNSANPRHLIRSLETGGQVPTKSGLRTNTLVIGLTRTKEESEERIAQRVDAMIKEGLIDEISRLSERYGWELPALQTTSYQAFRDYIAGTASLEQAKQQFIHDDLRYAKRQKTWFKRNPDIIWISNPEEAVDLVTTFLNK